LTSIDFYFNAPDRLQVACRLAGKALAQVGKGGFGDFQAEGGRSLHTASIGQTRGVVP